MSSFWYEVKSSWRRYKELFRIASLYKIESDIYKREVKWSMRSLKTWRNILRWCLRRERRDERDLLKERIEDVDVYSLNEEWIEWMIEKRFESSGNSFIECEREGRFESRTKESFDRFEKEENNDVFILIV